MNRKFLPMQLIYGGKTESCHPKMDFPLGSRVTYNPKHWSNLTQSRTKIIIPYTEKVEEEMKLPDSPKAIIVWNTFKGQNNNDVREE